jgi:glutaredoxin-like YruB-family protein
MDVKIYTTPTCGYCHQAKRFLADLGVNYTEYDVSRDRTAAEEMIRLTGQMGVPVIVVDGQAVIGFDQARLKQLLAGGSPRHPRFGLKVADASRVLAKSGGIPLSGALVGAVSPSSPGEKAGLRAGDVITEINLRQVNNADDLEQALASLDTGSRVTILFLRGENKVKSEIVV